MVVLGLAAPDAQQAAHGARCCGLSVAATLHGSPLRPQELRRVVDDLHAQAVVLSSQRDADPAALAATLGVPVLPAPV